MQCRRDPGAGDQAPQGWGMVAHGCRGSAVVLTALDRSVDQAGG
jgi:hypothetical protein